MNRKLRIACIGTRGLPSNYSGLESSCEGLYTELARRGHDITVYCRAEVGDTAQEYRGIRRRRIVAFQTKALETLSHVAVSLAHAFVCERYDVIHLHALAPGVFARACRIAGVPTVATVQGLDWQRAKWKGLASKVIQYGERSIVRNADSIVVVSRDLKTYFKTTYNRDTVYIPNGVEPANSKELSTTSTLAKYNLAKREFILYLGRLVPEKRIHDVIHAFKAIKTTKRLVITGGGGYTDYYVRSLQAAAVGDPRIVFTGAQPRSAVDALFSNAVGYVSGSELEGLPMSLLECISHGTPAVVSDIPPHKELLADIPGYDLLFNTGDVLTLQSKLANLLNAPDKYRTIAEVAQKHIASEYAWPRIADQTEDVLYHTVVQPHMRRRYFGRRSNDTSVKSEGITDIL